MNSGEFGMRSAVSIGDAPLCANVLAFLKFTKLETLFKMLS